MINQIKGRAAKKIIIIKTQNMPRLDRTGPLGYGPGTGRGMGPCGAGMGWGRGFGSGFGWRRFWTQKEEKEMLGDEAQALEQELKAIKERLAELKTQK